MKNNECLQGLVGYSERGYLCKGAARGDHLWNLESSVA